MGANMSVMTRRMACAAGAAAIFGASGVVAKTNLGKGAGGFSPEGLASIQAPALKAIASGDLPGVVTLVWRKGQLTEIQTAGLRDIERKLPMQRGTIFCIASMSKPVTVAAALTLVEQGRVRLEDPITKWAPEFADMRVLRRPDGPLDDTYPAPREITIEDLMTHRSGLSYSFLAPGPLGRELMQKIGMGIESPLTPDEWMKTLAALPLAYAPGERFNYGHSIDVLGFILGRVAGTSLRRVMREQLFIPLRMTDTDFWIPPATRNRAAVVYSSPASGSFTAVSIASFVGTAPPAYTSGGQGLVSTVDDYLTFARMLLRGGEADGVRVLKPETVRLMTRNHLTRAQRQIPFMGMPFWRGQGFGLGISVITDPAQHAWMGAGEAGAFGWPGAFGGWWQTDPAEDMALLWLQHTLPAPPGPGTLAAAARTPGAVATVAFQKAVYTALPV
jgi:CubicO group peptidase (beta-lactamase class C family)